MGKRGNDRLLWQKVLFTVPILVAYIIGRRIPVYHIDVQKYSRLTQDAQSFLEMSVGGDLHKISVFALGISPYMIASIVMMGVTAVCRAAMRSKVSMDKINKALYLLAFFVAICQAAFFVMDMHFLPGTVSEKFVKWIAFIELVTGAMLIAAMIKANVENGIGGQSILIIVNLIESFITMFKDRQIMTMTGPLGYAALAAVITLTMENAEFRMPVQRIFIHNIYKDKNYIAIKYNPVGVLPVMFSTAVFMFIQQIVIVLSKLPNMNALRGFAKELSLTKPLGIGVYIAVIYLLTIGFALVLVNPSEMADQMLKNNDSICNICSGKTTKRYLVRVIMLISLLSATAMSACMAVPLMLQLNYEVDSMLLMMPSAAMMLTSILVNLYRELKTAVTFECYRVFL